MSQAPALHHVALGARDVDAVAAFWRDVVGLPELETHTEDGGGATRSIWLDLGHGAILMIERTHRELDPLPGPVVGVGPFLIALRASPERRRALSARLAEAGYPLEDQTRYTSYHRDPEGNRLALSHFPEPPQAEDER